MIHRVRFPSLERHCMYSRFFRHYKGPGSIQFNNLKWEDFRPRVHPRQISICSTTRSPFFFGDAENAHEILLHEAEE